MAVNKVVYGTTVLVDLTEDTVTPASLLQGRTAHGKDGELIIGTLDPGGEVFDPAPWKHIEVGTITPTAATSRFSADLSIVTVEGNASNQVKKNTYNRNNSYIVGYGHPLYGEDDPAPVVTPPEEEPPVVTGCEIVLPQLKNGSVGSTVVNAQTLLIQKGYYCGGRIVSGRETPDGDFGPTTEKSVKSFQSKQNLQADGMIGTDTWKALLTG